MARKCVTVKKRKACVENVDRWSLSKMAVETLVEIGLLSLLVIILEAVSAMIIEVNGIATRSDIEAALVVFAAFTASFFIANFLSHLVMSYIKDLNKNNTIFLITFSIVETLLFLVIFQVISIFLLSVFTMTVSDTFTGMKGFSITFLGIALASVFISNVIAMRFYGKKKTT